MPSRPRRYRVSPDVAHRDIEEQTLLLAPDERDLLTLNETGRFVWRRLVAGRDVDTIVRAFARAFRLPAIAADRDVRTFLAQLERRRLIRRG
jgi:hypothetical protein